ncbi:hypothetical protein OG921_02960 [Aldersonia sp. NBC_00410]|uniref:hypothetical protein n=1 Tax=Aldersonia sp. NBC_00410 TaxID=2975954 RepID=UPI00225C25BE|nr:hypothetical protein [Aldersonia sp. NBC_00410]MCX5042151.1 hypothetical protein [Aldersonia sp. NBC_00410]
MSAGGWERARTIADAVLYEGYLLYPYRANSMKNVARFQWGVLGGDEPDSMSAQFICSGEISLCVRFLRLRHRQAQGDTPAWDEGVECELEFGPFDVTGLDETLPVRAEAVTGVVALRSERIGDQWQVSLTVRNLDAAQPMIGTHVIAEGDFVSLLEPPPEAESAVAACTQHRCFPVLAGKPGDHDLLLISPIILYDHPEVAEQSEGALFDATEIDEILTLRVMTMTDEEKAQARATDPRAAAIIDQCDAMTPEAMQGLHGTLREPHGLIPEVPNGVDWWDPFADNAVQPEQDAVLVNGVPVAKGSRVRLHPSRRADAQDLFFAGKTARVTAVHEDVDGQKHVAVVVEDDPAADLHDWYGRYLYFAPEEVEPIGAQP